MHHLLFTDSAGVETEIKCHEWASQMPFNRSRANSGF